MASAGCEVVDLHGGGQCALRSDCDLVIVAPMSLCDVPISIVLVALPFMTMMMGGKP
jgi:hypothetical protein